MTHGALTEPSLSYPVVTHDRKGREGKGVGREEEGNLSKTKSPTSLVRAELWTWL
jgi:hypothetical protein